MKRSNSGDIMALEIIRDPSKDVCGAVAYVVWNLSNGTNEAKSIVAKSSPKKQFFPVLLELCSSCHIEKVPFQTLEIVLKM